MAKADYHVCRILNRSLPRSLLGQMDLRVGTRYPFLVIDPYSVPSPHSVRPNPVAQPPIVIETVAVNPTFSSYTNLSMYSLQRIGSTRPIGEFMGDSILIELIASIERMPAGGILGDKILITCWDPLCSLDVTSLAISL